VKISHNEASELQQVLKIELDEEDINPYIIKGYNKVKNRVKIPGFRPGKAPINVVEQVVGKEGMINEVIDELAFEMSDRAIEKEGLDVSGTPRIELESIYPFVFTAKVPLQPIVDLGSYKNIRINKKTIRVVKKDVDEKIGQMRKQVAPWEPANRKVKAGDLITADIEAYVGNTKIMDENGAVFIVDHNTSLPFEEFTNHLVGMKAGQANKFSTKVSKDHPNAEIAGKDANFSVSLSEIKQQTLPELNDEFATSVNNGEYKNLEDLISKTKEQIRSEMDLSNENEHREGVINKLAEGANVELPELLIEREVENIISRRNEMIERMKITKEDYFKFTSKTEQQMDEEAKVDAEERLKRSWALTKLGELENVQVTEDEIETQLNLYKEQSKISKQKIKNRDIERVKLSIKESVFIGKSVDKIIEIAATKSVGSKKKAKVVTKKVGSKKKTKNVKPTEN
tara:strand:- start:319 stop:1686 length:1368 start_codon:yes stop_codon:yes gene_type:complete